MVKLTRKKHAKIVFSQTWRILTWNHRDTFGEILIAYASPSLSRRLQSLLLARLEARKVD